MIEIYWKIMMQQRKLVSILRKLVYQICFVSLYHLE